MVRTPYESCREPKLPRRRYSPRHSLCRGRLASFLDCYREDHWAAPYTSYETFRGRAHILSPLALYASLSYRHADPDYANCMETSRSTSGYCDSLGSVMISWSSQKQRHATDSTCYAEYVALHHAGKEAVFLRELLEGVGFPHRPPRVSTVTMMLPTNLRVTTATTPTSNMFASNITPSAI